MTKMSKTQRAVILAAHAGRTAVVAAQRTRDAMLRRGEITWDDRPTVAGLVAAGVDMVAIHAEAISANEILDAAVEQGSLRSLHFTRAVLAGKSYRAALDIVHAEALGESGSVSCIAEARAVVAATVDRDHAEALCEDGRRRPYMVQAAAIGDAERTRASGLACYHPRSCGQCRAMDKACGRHARGDVGHESCSGQAISVNEVYAGATYDRVMRDGAAWIG